MALSSLSMLAFASALGPAKRALCAGSASQSVDDDAAIVGECPAAAQTGGVAGLDQAFSTKVQAGSSGSGMASSPAPCRRQGRSASRLRSSSACAGCGWPAPRRAIQSRARASRCAACNSARPLRASASIVQLVLTEGMTLGRACSSIKPHAVIEYHVHVSLAVRVLGVIQVQYRDALPDADRNRRHLTVDRILLIILFLSILRVASTRAT